MQMNAAFPSPSERGGVRAVKKLYGYDREDPRGFRCDKLFAAYSTVYPEITAIRHYQEHCLSYWEKKLQEKMLHLQREKKESDLSLAEQDLHLVQGLKKKLKERPDQVLKRFRVGAAVDQGSCHLSAEFGASRAALWMDLKGMTLEEFEERPDSISGKTLKCTALCICSNESRRASPLQVISGKKPEVHEYIYAAPMREGREDTCDPDWAPDYVKVEGTPRLIYSMNLYLPRLYHHLERLRLSASALCL